jgi:hypothetical protein
MLDQSRVHLPNTRLLDEITTSLAHVAALQCARETARSHVERVDDRVFASATTRLGMENARISSAALHSPAAPLAEITTAAHIALADIPWNTIGEAVRVSALTRMALQDRFAHFTGSVRLYEGLLNPCQSHPWPSVV